MPRLAPIFLALSTLTATADETAATLTARGNEPGWRLDMTATELVLTTEAGQEIRAARPEGQPQADGGTLLSADGMAVTLWPVTCRDTMTGMPYPQQVQVALDGQVLSGCGGDPAALLSGDWRLVSVKGAPLAEGATLQLQDGRASGRAACNRFNGGYSLTGEGLGFSALAATRMACPPPAMEEEAAILAAFAAVDRFDIDESGQLVLIGGDVPLLLAAR
jgi:heat shock protein HslJ